MAIKQEIYAQLESGIDVQAFILTNANGLQAKIINWGGIIAELWAPDKNGKLADVVLGYDDMAGWCANPAYMGAIVGRYANRIAGGLFVIDDNEYCLAVNNGPNSLHGGLVGFDKVLWNAEIIGDSVKLSHISNDGEEGYPGKLNLTVTYRLSDANELVINYQAHSDKPTVINLTNHSYFNLAGHNSGSVLDHILQINASRYTPVDENLIPTGEIVPLSGTPLDFSQPTRIGGRIDDDFEQLKLGNGYDHNFVIEGDGLRLAARVVEPGSGRVLEVLTDQPGVQLYTGNYLDIVGGKERAIYKPRSGFCPETQHFPDSPNQPKFPSTILRPGENYDTTTIFKFEVER